MMTEIIVLDDAKGVRGIGERTTVRCSYDNIQPFFAGYYQVDPDVTREEELEES